MTENDNDLQDFDDYETEEQHESDETPGLDDVTQVVPDVDPENTDDELVEAFHKRRAEEIAAAKERGIEQFDLTLGMEFGIDPEDIRALAAGLHEAEAFDTDGAESETLAEYAAALKELTDAAEDARKEVFEAALDEQTEIGETVGPLVKTRGSRRHVSDEEGAIEAIQAAGGDPTQAMSLKTTDAADMLEALGVDTEPFIGETEYSYFRRQG